MIKYIQGNLFDAEVDALVNTVNTVGVMGKGIALMFKERYPENMSAYAKACAIGEVQTGKMFVTETHELVGPRWIINFPTKQHWRAKSRLSWIIEGLADLRRFIQQNEVRSIAIPALGAGNGGLDWQQVKLEIEKALSDLDDVEIIVYEPIGAYQNQAKQSGTEVLTPARALIAELVRRYWILGMECSLLEIQKLSWFLERAIESEDLPNPLELRFIANNYGPYADRLRHLLNHLDGSYLQCEKRINDCDPLDVIWFNDQRKAELEVYLHTEAQAYLPALEKVTALIDGFESPFGMELLSTVDWLLHKEHVAHDEDSLLQGVQNWPAGKRWAQRKLNIFDRSSLALALNRLEVVGLGAVS